MNESLVEAVKEFVRMQIVSLITATVSALTVIASGINTQTGDIFVNWVVIRASFLVFMTTSLATGLTKAVDKFIYKEQKDELKKGEDLEGWKGITGI